MGGLYGEAGRVGGLYREERLVGGLYGAESTLLLDDSPYKAPTLTPLTRAADGYSRYTALMTATDRWRVRQTAADLGRLRLSLCKSCCLVVWCCLSVSLSTTVGAA